MDIVDNINIPIPVKSALERICSHMLSLSICTLYTKEGVLKPNFSPYAMATELFLEVRIKVGFRV